MAFCLLLTTFCLLTTGCGPEWKRKFVRRRAKAQSAQSILILEPDHRAVLPAADRYREHFAFWKSWHSELISGLGQLAKRDRMNLDGAIGELEAMQRLLTGEPAGQMKEVLLELRSLQEAWDSAPSRRDLPVATRLRLEFLRRQIEREFHYSRVKDALVSDPPKEEEPLPAVSSEKAPAS